MYLCVKYVLQKERIYIVRLPMHIVFLCTFLLFCEKPTITSVDNWFEQTNIVDTKRITKGNGSGVQQAGKNVNILFGVMCCCFTNQRKLKY